MLGSLTLSFMFQAFEYISLHQFNHLFLSSKLADQIKDVHAQADQCEKVRACKEQVTPPTPPDRPNAPPTAQTHTSHWSLGLAANGGEAPGTGRVWWSTSAN